MLKSIFIFFVVSKVLLQQLCFVVSLVIARLKVISVNPIVTVYVNDSLVLWHKHRRNLIMANDLSSKIMHQNNILKDTPAFFLIRWQLLFASREPVTPASPISLPAGVTCNHWTDGLDYPLPMGAIGVHSSLELGQQEYQWHLRFMENPDRHKSYNHQSSPLCD